MRQSYPINLVISLSGSLGTNTIGACRIFTRVGKLGVWGQVPKQSPGMEPPPPVEVCGQSSQKPTTGCKNNA